MDNAHEETGDGIARGTTTQPAFTLGQASSGGPEVAAFDPREWLGSVPQRQPWKKRLGIGAAAGTLALLGWIGGKQLQPNPANAANETSESSAAADNDPFFAAESDVIGEPASGENAALRISDDSVIRAQDAPAVIRPAENLAERPNSEPAKPVNPFAQFQRAATAEGASNTTVAAADSPPAADPFNAFATPETQTGEETQPADLAAPVEEAVQDDAWGAPAKFKAPAMPELKTAASQEVVEEDPWGSVSENQTEPAIETTPAAESAPAIQAVSNEELVEEEIDTTSPSLEFSVAPEPEQTAEAESNSSSEQQPGFGPPAFSDAPFQPAPAETEPEETNYSPTIESPSAQPRGFSAPVEPREIVPTTALGDPSNETIHVVQSGETYWSIARQHYSAGRYFKALVEYNKPRIADARALKPGMKVLIPDAEVLDAKFASHIPSGAPAKKQPGGLFFDSAGQPFYRVGPSDSLGGIAQRHLGRSSRSQEIFELNQDVLASPHKLKLGTILKMPENASQVEAAASLPVNR